MTSSRGIPGSEFREPRRLVLPETEHGAAGDDDEVIDAHRARLVPRARQRFLDAPLLRARVVSLHLDSSA